MYSWDSFPALCAPLLLGLHKSTCIQTPLNWTGMYIVMEYLWMAWIIRLVLQWIECQILFYGKKLRKFSSGEIVQRFQPCFAEQISSIDTWASVTAKRTFLNTHLTRCFPITETVKFIRFLPQTDVCFCQNTVERIRFGYARETKTCG